MALDTARPEYTQSHPTCQPQKRIFPQNSPKNTPTTTTEARPRPPTPRPKLTSPTFHHLSKPHHPPNRYSDPKSPIPSAPHTIQTKFTFQPHTGSALTNPPQPTTSFPFLPKIPRPKKHHLPPTHHTGSLPPPPAQLRIRALRAIRGLYRHKNTPIRNRGLPTGDTGISPRLLSELPPHSFKLLSGVLY